MSKIPFHGAGNLTTDPELRTTPNGHHVATLRLAINRRKSDGNGNWTDAEPTFLTAVVWGDSALNVAASLSKGQRVIIAGELITRSWTEKGQKRTALEIVVDDLGPSLRWATAVPALPATGAEQLAS